MALNAQYQQPAQMGLPLRHEYSAQKDSGFPAQSYGYDRYRSDAKEDEDRAKPGNDYGNTSVTDIVRKNMLQLLQKDTG